MPPLHSATSPAGAVRPVPARTFIFRNYVRLFLTTALFSLALLLGLMAYQARTLNRVYVEKSRDVIQLHRNELLNEIALQDFSSLTQHLNYMQNEMNADQIVLIYEGRQYDSSVRGKRQPSTFDHAISKLGGIHPFHVDIANEFGTFQAVLQVSYLQSLVAWILSPVFFSVLAIAGLSWVPVALVFVVIFRRLRNSFIDPLNAVTASLRERTSQSTAAQHDLEPIVEEIVQLQRACEQYRLVEAEAAFATIARQVSHDIRSPLAALDTLLSLIDDLPEDQRVLLRTAIGRIRDLSNNLLTKAKAGFQASVATHEASPATSEFLVGLIESVISEKRQQHRPEGSAELAFQTDSSTFDLCAKVEPARMKRVLSNLWDNASEALGAQGQIQVSLRRAAGHAELTIRDNGRGIPAAILPKLMERGSTYGKPGGSGLGLAFARECASAWGGELHLESVEGQGTTVTLRLPSASPPPWFCPALDISPGTKVIVIDDDPSIHEVWRRRFAELAASSSTELIHLTTLPDLERFCKEQRDDSSRILYLCDFEFRGAEEDGLSVSERLGIAGATVLVTNRADEPTLRARCQKLAVAMLPKSMAPSVPIRVA